MMLDPGTYLSTASSPVLDFAPRLTYAIAPPDQVMPLERRRALAAAQSNRIASLPIDALLVYDVQDEAARNAQVRPFAFRPKVDPLSYALDELDVGALPCVVYRAITDLPEPTLRHHLERLQARGGHAVLVGAPSRSASVSLSLPQAYAVCRAHAPTLSIGGVLIPERHETSGGEDARVWAKARQGCSFFVSQVVWSPGPIKRLLRDLCRHADAKKERVPSLLLTLSPCGSSQTLDFLQWLGVDIPISVKHDLLSAKDVLARSIDLATEIYAEVHAFAATLGITVGCNVESVSSRRAEVEASVELVHRVDPIGVRPWARSGCRDLF